MTFGREMVDARGPVADFPAASMLTGLFANALGWRWEERDAHAALQSRLRFAARIDRPGHRITDFQTAQLGAKDQGWTTRGVVEGRDGASYGTPHIRTRDYDADRRVAVATRLEPPGDALTVEHLAAALVRPARPLFIGRKPCLPSRPILHGVQDHATLLAALDAVPAGDDPARPSLVLLPLEEPAAAGDELRSVTDERDWHSGVHGGARTVRIRRAARPEPAP